MASISNQAATTLPIPYKTNLVVSNELLARSLAGNLHSQDCSVELTPDLCLEAMEPKVVNDVNIFEYGDYSFIRDSQITLHDGTVYVPSCTDDYHQMAHKALLPLTASKFVQAKLGCAGFGFMSEKNQEIHSYLGLNELPMIQGNTRIEGGNARLFKDLTWNRKALIGNFSLYLSMLALDEIQFFSLKCLQKYVDQIKASPKAPNEQALLRARNQNLSEHISKIEAPFRQLIKEADCLKDKEFAKKMKEEISSIYHQKLQEEGLENGIDTVYEIMRSPLTKEERAALRDKAILLMAKLQLTKRVIAQELRIPLEHIAFVFQDHFHIDEDCFVLPLLGPGGTVFYHSELEAQKVLLKLLAENPSAAIQKRLKNYLNASIARTKTNIEITEKNRKKFAKIQCNAIPLPGVFEAPGEPSINFMNGFEHRGVFFTNGSKERMFELAFLDAMKNASPETDIRFVDTRKGEGMMEFFLTHTHGGLNCMTWSYKKQPESFVTVKPLENEIEPWEMTQLGDVSSLVGDYVGDPHALLEEREKTDTSRPANTMDSSEKSLPAGES